MAKTSSKNKGGSCHEVAIRWKGPGKKTPADQPGHNGGGGDRRRNALAKGKKPTKTGTVTKKRSAGTGQPVNRKSEKKRETRKREKVSSLDGGRSTRLKQPGRKSLTRKMGGGGRAKKEKNKMPPQLTSNRAQGGPKSDRQKRDVCRKENRKADQTGRDVGEAA